MNPGKRRNKNLLLATFLLILMTNLTTAQELWNLEKCINYALENNIQIKQQELYTRYSENNLKQSKAEVLPDFNGRASQSFTFGRGVDPFDYDFKENINSNNFNVSSSVTLFNGFQSINTIKKNEFNLQKSLQDLERMKNDISLNIASIYLQILFNQELTEIALNNVDITNLQVERTRKLVDAGSLAKGNLLEIESQEAMEELQLINAENQLRISYLTLQQILDLDTTQEFRIFQPAFEEFQPQEITITVDEIYQAASQLPQIKSSEYQLKVSEKNLAIAKV